MLLCLISFLSFLPKVLFVHHSFAIGFIYLLFLKFSSNHFNFLFCFQFYFLISPLWLLFRCICYSLSSYLYFVMLKACGYTEQPESQAADVAWTKLDNIAERARDTLFLFGCPWSHASISLFGIQHLFSKLAFKIPSYVKLGRLLF